MAKLFISHASEDKDAFVRPLAKALKAVGEVWYDEYELKVGDSLRKKIDEGLRDCDFGVVVLSKAFFLKKWTQAELDGLLALEETNHKLILPVWYQVTKADVEKFSPILAGRLAAIGERGVASVVDELRLAINASDRTRQVAAPSRSQSALRGLAERLNAADHEDKFLASRAGVDAVAAGAAKIVSRVAAEVKAADADSQTKRFNVERALGPDLLLYGPYWVKLETGLRDYYTNTAASARLIVRIVKMNPNGSRFQEGRVCWEKEWRARCAGDKQVTWAQDRLSPIHNSHDEVADEIVERLVAVVHGEKNVAEK